MTLSGGETPCTIHRNKVPPSTNDAMPSTIRMEIKYKPPTTRSVEKRFRNPSNTIRNEGRVPRSAAAQAAMKLTENANEQVEDVFVDGQRGVKVTQPDGSTYYLLPAPSAGPLRDPTDSGMRVPLWVIRQF